MVAQKTETPTLINSPELLIDAILATEQYLDTLYTKTMTPQNMMEITVQRERLKLFFAWHSNYQQQDA